MGYRIPESKRQLITVKWIALPKQSQSHECVNTRCASIQKEHTRIWYPTSSQTCLSRTPSLYIASNGRGMCFTSCDIIGKTLTTSRSLIYSAHVLLCILTSMFIIFGMSLVSRSANNPSNVCWRGLSGQKNRYCHHAFFRQFLAVFLTCRCKYVLHNVIQNSGKSGCVNWLHTQRISLCLLTNRLQMREQAIENAVGLLSALHLTNTES